jgi:hypothetical protein
MQFKNESMTSRLGFLRRNEAKVQTDRMLTTFRWKFHAKANDCNGFSIAKFIITSFVFDDKMSVSKSGSND